MFNLRPANESDLNFVAASWKQSFRKEYPKLSKAEFFDLINPVIDEVLARSKVIIACDPETPEFIHGYSVYKVESGIGVIHFAYVKESFRKFGILKSIIKTIKEQAKDGLVGTFKRHRDEWIYEKFKIIYNPKLKDL